MDNVIARDILVVEDEMLIAAQLSEVLVELGCRPRAVHRIEEALQMIASASFDAAFLDLNLEGESSVSVAEVLASRGTPFVFMSGYASSDVQTAYPGVPLVPKPFTEHEIERALLAML